MKFMVSELYFNKAVTLKKKVRFEKEREYCLIAGADKNWMQVLIGL